MRGKTGSSMALIVTLVCSVGLALLLFGLKYTRELGSYQEERTAIDAAALAAAKDISRVVVEDAHFGFVGLSDAAPNGRGTTAGDGYALPVTGINTLLATVRLDMIVADYMQDPTMRALAAQDYRDALAAQANLTAHLSALIAGGGTAVDADGQAVEPMKDALEEYQKNAIRMEGRSAELVPGSLKLSLGFITGAQSSMVRLPRPLAVAQVSSSEQSNLDYMPNVPISYKGANPLVFAALDADTQLVSSKRFVATIGAAGAVPSVVKADAVELYHDSDFQGQSKHSVHVSSAAMAGCIADQRPNPGSFCLSFPNGMASGITTLGDIFKQNQIVAAPTDCLQTCLTGDYPLSPLSNYSIATAPSLDKSHPPFNILISVAFYDWVRRAGTNVDVGNLLSALSRPLSPSLSGPQRHVFRINPDGSVGYNVTAMTPVNYVVSQNQWRAISGLGFDCVSSTGAVTACYDLQLSDYVRQPGRISGGKHGGEPLPLPGMTVMNPSGSPPLIPTLLENPSWPYQAFTSGPGGGTIRPTYLGDGIAADLTFRLRQ